MKRKFIVCGKDGRPSMKRVYSQLETKTPELLVRRAIKGKEPFVRHYTNALADYFVKKPIDIINAESSIVIRWGTRMDMPTNNETIVYNKASSIELATNKLKSRIEFIRNNVRCPNLYTPSMDTVTFPIIARPFVHSKGKNFVVIPHMEAFKAFSANYPEGWYYSQFIDKEREFRVHCAHGKVLGIMEKPAIKGEMAWNRAINHESFTRVRQANYIHDVCLQALNAVSSLKLDFGGVDVILKDNQAYVLEVNTAPTLNSSDYISSQYAKYFKWLFDSDTRNPHWDYTSYSKPASFAWKQDQF